MQDVYNAKLKQDVWHEGDIDHHLLDGSQVRQYTEISNELENLDLEPKQTGEKLAENDHGVFLRRREDRFDVEQLGVLEVEEDDDEKADTVVWWRRRWRR